MQGFKVLQCLHWSLPSSEFYPSNRVVPNPCVASQSTVRHYDVYCNIPRRHEVCLIQYSNVQRSVNKLRASVRATNVYEEKSLGVFDSEEDLIEPENDEIRSVDRRVAIWGKYLMRHVRRQLSFG